MNLQPSTNGFDKATHLIEQIWRPQSIEAEQALLGAILINPEAYERVSDFLKPEAFFDPLHGQIYEICGRVLSEGGLVRPTTLAPFFEGADMVGELTVPQYLGRLAANAITVINARAYGQTIQDMANRRQLQDMGRDLQEAASNAAVGVSGLVSDMVSEADDMLAQRHDARKTRWTIAEAGKAALDELRSDKPRRVVTTGYATLDDALGGFRPGQFYLLGGRPSMGKTAVAVSSGLRAAKDGSGGLYFSMEMGAEALAQRCLSDLSWSREMGIPYEAIEQRAVAPDEIWRLDTAQETLADLPFIIDGRPSLSMAQIASRTRQESERLAVKGHRLDLVIIDHLGKVQASNRYAGNMVAETSEISAALAALAKDLDVAVLALSQLSRDVEKRDDKRPMLSDLRWTGALEQDADVVMFAYRESYYVERMRDKDAAEMADRMAVLAKVKHQLQILIEKNRSGALRTVDLYCDITCNVVRDR